ncbi:hypothetical protein [Microbispora sp. GKU 823]|uniref:hypothetical protein n=1 Tax=Microbispora sp. GKU 823 TaxID=1652100 RepID=UPI001C4E280C|nr:hypothetical protein [Microbispora sp. GKU 823]
MTVAANQERSTFRACFAVAEFRVLFGSQLLLVLGDTVKMLAFSVLVFARTGSPGLAALAYMIGFLPQVAGGMLLLSLADRWRPRTLMVAGDLLRVATCLVLGLGDLPIGVMLALVFAAGVPTPLFSAARSAVLPDVLAGGRVRARPRRVHHDLGGRAGRRTGRRRGSARRDGPAQGAADHRRALAGQRGADPVRAA